MADDPNDPGYVLDANSFRRLVEGIRRIETTPLNHDPGEEIPNRRIYEKPRLVRGQSTATQSGAVVLMKNIVPLSSGMPPPVLNASGQLRVANIYFPRSLDTNQWFQAVYSPNVIPSDDVRADGVQVDWEVLEAGTGVSSSLRRFELVQDKFTYQSPAVVQWLDDSENLITGTDLVYDPEHQFSGVVSGYVGTGPGFRGNALLRTDMGTAVGTGLGGNRWEMIDLEGYARWIIATYGNTGTGTSSPDDYIYQGIYPVDDEWQTREPYPADAVVYTTSSPLVTPIEGDKVLLNLLDANGDGYGQPVYTPVCVKDRTAICEVVASGTATPAGGSVTPSSGVFPGKYGNTINATSDVSTPCWLVDLKSRSVLANNTFHLGRFVGLFPVNGTGQLPMFAIEGGSLRAVTGFTTAIVRADAATFTINSLTSIAGLTPPSPLTVEQSFPVGYASGQLVMAIETENNHWINTPNPGKVRTSSADMLPEYLADSIDNHSTFNGTNHQIVYVEELINDVPTQNYHVRFFTDKAGTGTDTGTDIHSVSGLILTLTSTLLTVELDYKTYRVTGTQTGTGSYISSVAVGACGT